MEEREEERNVGKGKGRKEERKKGRERKGKKEEQNHCIAQKNCEFLINR